MMSWAVKSFAKCAILIGCSNRVKRPRTFDPSSRRKSHDGSKCFSSHDLKMRWQFFTINFFLSRVKLNLRTRINDKLRINDFLWKIVTGTASYRFNLKKTQFYPQNMSHKLNSRIDESFCLSFIEFFYLLEGIKYYEKIISWMISSIIYLYLLCSNHDKIHIWLNYLWYRKMSLEGLRLTLNNHQRVL